MPSLPSSPSLLVLIAVAICASAVRAQPAAPPAAPATIRPTENLIVEGIPDIPAGWAAEGGRCTEAWSAG